MNKFLILILIIIALPMVCATKFVEYNAYEAVITENSESILLTQQTNLQETAETILKSNYCSESGIEIGNYKYKKYNWFEKNILGKDNINYFTSKDNDLLLTVKAKHASSTNPTLQIDKITNKQILNNINTKQYYKFTNLDVLSSHTGMLSIFAINKQDADFTYKKIAGRNWELWSKGQDNKCEFSGTGDYLICEIAANLEAIAVTDNSNLVPVNDFNVIGYKCNDKNCQTLGAQVFSQQSENNKLIIQYPEKNKPNQEYGYGLYFYKPGFITWEVNSYYDGKGSDTQQNPGKISNVRFAKKQGAHAPIEDIKVINTAYPNMPIMINIKTNIDSQTYSALRHAGPLNAVPEELKDYYQVDTRIILEIRNKETQQIIHTQTKDISIDFSGSGQVQFQWMPTITNLGKQVITVITDPIDEKIDQNTKILEKASKEIQVIEDKEELKNKCYTILNNLETSDQFITQGETLSITANKISNYVNENGYLTPVENKVILEVFDQNMNLVYTSTIDLRANQDTFTPQQFSTAIPEIFTKGQYTIQLTGTTEDALICQDKENIIDKISTGIIIDQIVQTDNHPPTIYVPDQTLEIGESVTLNLNNYIDDQDNDNLQLIITKQPDANIVDLDDSEINNKRITLTGISQGATTMNIEVTDSKESARHLFTITVTQESGTNQPPVITSRPETTAKLRQLYTYQVKAKDPENDYLEFSLTESPAGMTIDSQTGLIQYTPAETGNYQVRLQVTDSYSTAEQNYKLNVEIQKSKKHLFTLSSELNALNTIAQKGKYFTNHILLRNIGQESEKNIKVKVSIPEIGFSQQIIKELNLGPHDTKWVPLIFKVPSNAKPGTYLFVVETSNKHYSTTKYGTMTVADKKTIRDKYVII